MLEVIAVVVVFAYIAGYVVGYFAPAKHRRLLVSSVPLFSPFVLVLIFSLCQETIEAREVSLGWGIFLAPFIALLSCPSALLGGQISQKDRKRKVEYLSTKTVAEQDASRKRKPHFTQLRRRLDAHIAWWKRETKRLNQPRVLIATLVGFVLVALLVLTSVIR